MAGTASNNRRRGAAAERRVAAALGGAVYRGPAGDVDALGYRVEVKSSVGFQGYGNLRDHIDQAIRNSAASGKPWLLALTGGKSYRNAELFGLLPLAELRRLIEEHRDRQVIVSPHRFGKIAVLVDALHEALHDRRDPDAGGE